MNSDQGVELAIVLLSLLIYVAYHVQYFILRPWLRQRYSKKSRHTAIFFASSDARLVWTFLASQNTTDAGVPAVQTLRNSIMAASFMATTTGLMATSGLLPVLTEGNRLSMIRKLGDLDPIVNLAGSSGLITAEWKVGICEFLLLASLLFFVQAIRLLMYLGYLIKIRSAGEPFASAFPADLVLAFAARSGHCWTAGIRTWTLFIPALFWFFGPLILLITTILVVLFLAFTDEISLRDFSHITAAEGAELREAHAPTAPCRREVAAPALGDAVVAAPPPALQGGMVADRPAAASAAQDVSADPPLLGDTEETLARWL